MTSAKICVRLDGAVVESIDSLKFMKASLRYRMDFMTIGLDVSVVSRVSREALQEFLNGCQGKAMNLAPANANQILALCEEWNTPKLKREVEAFMAAHERDMIVDFILERKNLGQATHDLELTLHEQFVDLCRDEKYEQLQRLGVSLLLRIFEMNERSLVREHLHDVFGFIVSCLRNESIGSVASVFFSGAKFSDFSAEEKHALLHEPAMDFSFLNCGTFASIVEYDSVVSKYQMLLEESEQLRALQSKEIAELKAENAAMREEMRDMFEHFKVVLNSRIDSETKTQSELEKQTTAMLSLATRVRRLEERQGIKAKLDIPVEVLGKPAAKS